MRFDRWFAAVAALLFGLPTLGWGNERTDLEGVRKLALRREAAAKGATSSGQGQIGSAAVSVDTLLAAMDVDPVIVVNPLLTGAASQSAVFPGLGMLQPTFGPNFAWLSSGIAGAGTTSPADPSGTDPLYGGEDAQVGSGNDVPPQFQSCGTNPSNNQLMYDCVEFSFSFVVPAGMHSISFDFDFLSTEYPEFVGPFFAYDDRFVVSIASPTHNYSNIVFDVNGNPLTIDSAFFNQPCSTLIGTGFGIVDFSGDCDAGGTGLLTTSAPVEPGETVAITFRLHDEGDSSYDSAVMIDNFFISEEEVEGPTTEGQVMIDYLSPKSGPLGGGTSVLIHGEGFEEVSAVSFGGIPALFTSLDASTIQAIAPPHSEGAVDVAVTASPGNGVSTGVRAGAFIYYVSPEGSPLQVISVDPAEGPGQGGVAVAVRGSGFKSDTIITFDGEAAESQQFINGDEIVVITPSGSGSADIRAVNPDGTDAELEGGYVYIGGPGGNGANNNFVKGCSCSLESTTNPASSAAAPLAIFGLVLAAWLVRRRSFDVRKASLAAAVLPLAILSVGCNDPQLAPVNSAPIADAGPSSEAFVGSEITLDGTESRDFEDGTNIQFHWEIVTKPDGSAVQLDDPSEKTPSFIPDVAGLYRIGLVVVDSDEIESGPIGFGGNDDDNLTDVIALPFRDLRVILSWDTDDSDLDVHLIRPNNSFNFGYWDPEYDCFYGAPDPEWGSNGIEADNPLLAVDIDTGMGPEEIDLASPQDNGLYRIYVHVFNQHGAAPANAVVSISVEGSVIAEVVSASPLNATDAVWQVGTLSWPENVFTEDNTFTTHSALGGPAH